MEKAMKDSKHYHTIVVGVGGKGAKVEIYFFGDRHATTARKPEIAAAQAYFAVSTRAYEIHELRAEQEELCSVA
jgi:hypothetical protein